jgi:hypothetical protein
LACKKSVATAPVQFWAVSRGARNRRSENRRRCFVMTVDFSVKSLVNLKTKSVVAARH